MSKNEFQDRLILSSVPLVKLNKDGIPVATASGCLIDYSGRRILLTVAHATGDQGDWAIQCRYVPGKGAEVYKLGPMNFLTRGSLLISGLNDVDFSYVKVPVDLVVYRQEMEPPNLVRSERKISVHALSFEELPERRGMFGFCGVVGVTQENHFGQIYMGGDVRVYAGLSFLRTEDDYHVFTLPFDHPGHEYFYGCSGAPILSSKGAVVGLVCKGYEETNEIWAISTKAYKTPIDILVGNVK